MTIEDNENREDNVSHHYSINKDDFNHEKSHEDYKNRYKYVRHFQSIKKDERKSMTRTKWIKNTARRQK